MHPLAPVVQQYLSDIRAQRALPNSTRELSYRNHLGRLFDEVKKALDKPVTFTNEPTLIDVGRPDFEVLKGVRPIGYVEAEALDVDLSQLPAPAREQNERFRNNLHNFLLTNHLDFRLYIEGQEIAKACLPTPPDFGAIPLAEDDLNRFQLVLEQFLEASVPQASTPEQIARQLAHRARFLDHAAHVMLSQTDSELHPMWNAYKQTLFQDITAREFADIYAQTFTYGLFLSWMNFERTEENRFTRIAALDALPTTVPVIHAFMNFGGGGLLPARFKWVIDGICSDLDACKKESVLRPFRDGRDPVFHFYETFLGEYNEKQREQRGVYYTPDPVVSFIMRAVDDLLKNSQTFAKRQGLAEPSVTLLDPAVGTGTFLAQAYQRVYETLQADEEEGLWANRARNHVAKNFCGLELLPSAYTLAHIKLRQKLKALGAPLPDRQRLRVYLVNTLVSQHREVLSLPFIDVLSREATEAEKATQEKILVIVGNPPYSVNSANPSKDTKGKPNFIGGLLRDYYMVDGEPLNEQNPKGLQDDYVKFLRYAQHLIARCGEGIVGFVTNHGYLDNPTFRGMRQSLMQTFHQIYIYDLHGNSKKKEQGPGGSVDKNVFDIQQGVCICLLVKHAALGDLPGQVFHADLYGLRQHKYLTLQEQRLQDIAWQEVKPSSPFYLLRPHQENGKSEYEEGVKITDVFKQYSSCMNTLHDGLVVAFDKERLTTMLADARNKQLSDAAFRNEYHVVDSRDWSLATARAKLATIPQAQQEEAIRSCLYRAFDHRWIVLLDALVGYPRWETTRHFLHPNSLGLCTARQTLEKFSALVSRIPLGQHKIVDPYNRSYVFPLWLQPTPEATAMGLQPTSNLKPEFVNLIAKRIGFRPTPEDTLHYIYAVFHAPTYGRRNADFLKMDFPRVPLPLTNEVFTQMAALGKDLVALHLLEHPKLTPTQVTFPKKGEDSVHRVKKMRTKDRYTPPSPMAIEAGWSAEEGAVGRLHLNEVEYFGNVPPEAWHYRVGGYQPVARWIEDRTDRMLSEDEIQHYRRVIAALRETEALLPELDNIFQEAFP